MGGVQTKRRLLQGCGRVERGSQSEFRHARAASGASTCACKVGRTTQRQFRAFSMGRRASLARRVSGFSIESNMQVDFAVELGREDETLELPWSSEDGRLRYHDLKREPAAITHI